MTHLHLSVPGAWHYGSQDSEASEAIEGAYRCVDAANAVALTAPLLLQDRPSFLPLGNLATTLEETQLRQSRDSKKC